jgi:two-component system nitrogen regulation response regulator GlnG
MNGLEALDRLRAIANKSAIIVMTAHGTLSVAVRAVEGGAFDYLAKPFDWMQALEVVKRALNRPNGSASFGDEEAECVEEIVGRSPAMQSLYKQIALVAPRDINVLIVGESGTGKELVARAIHRHSRRRGGPFIPVHIAALNPNLVESELFGHVRGAFTGAAETRHGLLPLANGGTLFLDELADIPLSVQAKLLRVLEFQELLPVGGTKPQSLDVRIVAATHRDLGEAVQQGEFRHDLYYRLNSFQLRVPALRERGDDVVLLAEHFLRRIDPDSPSLLSETQDYLRQRQWPGNVRELRHAVESAVIVARGEPLRPYHFPQPLVQPIGRPTEERIAELVRVWVRERAAAAAPSEPTNLHEQLFEICENALVDEVLRLLHGNRLGAARWLGLARATVRKVISRLGQPEPTESRSPKDSR